MSDGTVTCQIRGDVAWVTLDRPEKLNAITQPMVAALHSALDEAEQAAEARVIVLAGAGRAFSSGYALGGEAEPTTEAEWRTELARDLGVTMRVWACPKPTIARVQGWCLGGAFDLALACDLVVASDDARFGLPEIRFGSAPVSLLLPFMVGQKRANELILTGDHVPASVASDWGLVNHLVAPAELDDAVASLVSRIGPTSAEVLALTKRSLVEAYEAMGLRPAQAVMLELGARINALDTPEARAFAARAASDGLKAALAWRAAAYGDPPPLWAAPPAGSDASRPRDAAV